MIAYKLIKKYPGSRELGTIEYYEKFYSSQNWEGTEYYDAHPEFWEKVEELDYEILDFKLHKLGYATNCNDINKSVSILSVKRISDGEVFTIGDEATVESDKKRYKIIKIRRFTDAIQVHGEIDGKSFFYNLNDVIKLQPITPLFTTEDGVDILDKNQKVFSVSECDFSIQNHQDFAWIKTRSPQRKYHHFFTKENAEAYILYNKPCLSIKEIGSNIPEGTLLRLLDTVKSKL